MFELAQYMKEIRTELQELFESFDNEIRNSNDEEIYSDAYNNIGSKLEDAIGELNIMIGSIENGDYNKDHEVEEY
jgi:hypothetical protein